MDVWGRLASLDPSLPLILLQLPKCEQLAFATKNAVGLMSQWREEINSTCVQTWC